MLHLKDLIEKEKPLYNQNSHDINSETAVVALWLLLAPLREQYMQINVDLYADTPVTPDAFDEALRSAMEFSLCFPKVQTQLPPDVFAHLGNVTSRRSSITLSQKVNNDGLTAMRRLWILSTISRRCRCAFRPEPM